jgi:hypothetical protein
MLEFMVDRGLRLRLSLSPQRQIHIYYRNAVDSFPIKTRLINTGRMDDGSPATLN